MSRTTKRVMKIVGLLGMLLMLYMVLRPSEADAALQENSVRPVVSVVDGGQVDEIQGVAISTNREAWQDQQMSVVFFLALQPDNSAKVDAWEYSPAAEESGMVGDSVTAVDNRSDRDAALECGFKCHAGVYLVPVFALVADTFLAVPRATTEADAGFGGIG